MKSSHNQGLFDKQVGLESLRTALYCVPHCDEMTKYIQRERKQMMKFSFLEVFHSYFDISITINIVEKLHLILKLKF